MKSTTSQKTNRLPPCEDVRPKVAADAIGCSKTTVYRLIQDGSLESHTVLRRGKDRGIRLISIKSLEKFLSQSVGNFCDHEGERILMNQKTNKENFSPGLAPMSEDYGQPPPGTA
jgi:excisionase family DNA binding protein